MTSGGTPGGSDASSTGAGHARATLLIIEDEALMRETLRNFLQQALPAWTIVDASDGAAALAACEAFAPGIVLMDIALPDADGIRLTSRVKALLPDARVVFVSYHCGTSFRERALAAGGNGFVAKDRLFADLVPAIVAAAGTDG